MIIYGLNPVLEAIRSHADRLQYVGVVREHGGKVQRVIADAKKAGVPVRMLPAEQIDRLANRGVHNGVIADLSEAAYADFDEAIETAKFVLILDGITDPQNLGAILRVADGFGVNLVVIPQHDSVGLTPAAVKASAGASEWIRVAQVTNLARAIESLQKAGFWVYAAAANRDAPDGIALRAQHTRALGTERQ